MQKLQKPLIGKGATRTQKGTCSLSAVTDEVITLIISYCWWKAQRVRL